MPSFDVVSELDHHEITNAIDQANREVGQRFDFKGSNAEFERTKTGIQMTAEQEFQLQQMDDILRQKLVKRGVDLKALDPQEAETVNRRARQLILLREGIVSETAKKLVKEIKNSKLKVQAAIQDDQLRVTGKKRDDLQQVMAMLRADDSLDLPLQFKNFRD